MIFYNPHIDDFLAEPLHFKLLKRRALRKYGFFLEECIRRDGKAVIFVDSSILPDKLFFLLPLFLRTFILKIEIQFWKKRNGFSDRVSVHYNTKKLNPSAILLFFSYKIAINSFEKRLKNISFFEHKVCHLSHYFIATAIKSSNLQKIEGLWLAGDADISDNAYFKHFFDWYSQPVLLLSFTIGKRFTVREEFGERKDQCVATGTFHNLLQETPAWKYNDFTDFFKSSTYHPVRKSIAENSEKWSDRMKIHVSLYRANDKGGLFKFLNHFFVSQKKYFSIDIVDLYNQYKFAVVGEELSGFPALGAFEAMACGCVLFAQPEYYKGLPVEAGVHFIAYNGDPANIYTTIAPGTLDDDYLVQMSAKGRVVVEQYFNAVSVTDIFFKQLNKNGMIAQ